MNPERLQQIILSPVISEKSTSAADLSNQVVFEVLSDATKNEIRERFGKTPGKRRNWKKAYVRLAEGQDIDFMGGA